MSRSRTRARERRRRLEAQEQQLRAGLRQAFIEARDADDREALGYAPTPGHGRLWQLLKELDRWDLSVWDLADAIDLTEDEKAMITQAVAVLTAGDSRLAAMTPGSVLHRKELLSYTKKRRPS